MVCGAGQRPLVRHGEEGRVMADRTLFGDPLPRRFGRLPGRQQTLGTGAEWMDGARDQAALLGRLVLQFDAGRRVLLDCDGIAVWHDVVWLDVAEKWTLHEVQG